MRGTGVVWRSMLALFVLCVPVAAGADGQPSQVAETSPTGSEEPYVVKKGDTLWGISKDLLQDPLLWPRLWEQNRFIADPNRIYPGDQLNLPGKELAPAPAPVAETPHRRRLQRRRLRPFRLPRRAPSPARRNRPCLPSPGARWSAAPS
jgi:LysM repeat protein